MSKVEMFLIIGACLVPFIALIFVLPKHKKKTKTPPPTTSYVKEDKKEEKPAAPVQSGAPIEKQVSKPKITKPTFDEDDDFKAYLELKKKRTQAPEPIDEGSFVRSPVGEYIPARLRNKMAQTSKNKSIAEQINDLSPELKAMLLAGVLDKKDY